MSSTSKSSSPTPKPRKPSRPTPAAATGSASPPRQPIPPFAPRPITTPVNVTVQVLVSTSSSGDHATGLGRSFFASSPEYPKAISIVLNSSFGPLLRALQRNDQSFLVLAFSVLFTEFCNFRSRKNPIIDRLRTRLITKYFPGSEHCAWSMWSNLACRLVPLFSEKFPRYITTKPELVITLSFECDQAEAVANWIPANPQPSSSHTPRPSIPLKEKVA